MAVVALRSQISSARSFHVTLQETPGDGEELACTAQGRGSRRESSWSSDGEKVSAEVGGVNGPSYPLGHKAMDGLILQQERPGQGWNEEQPSAQGGFIPREV